MLSIKNIYLLIAFLIYGAPYSYSYEAKVIEVFTIEYEELHEVIGEEFFNTPLVGRIEDNYFWVVNLTTDLPINDRIYDGGVTASSSEKVRATDTDLVLPGLFHNGTWVNDPVIGANSETIYQVVFFLPKKKPTRIRSAKKALPLDMSVEIYRMFLNPMIARFEIDMTNLSNAQPYAAHLGRTIVKRKPIPRAPFDNR